MKASFLPTLLATLSGLAASSPIIEVAPSNSSLPDDGALVKRATGSLSAWTSAGSGCAGTPGWTWPNPGQNQCIQFVGGDGHSKIVQRLSWSGQACQVYGYAATGCNSNQQATAFGDALCFKGVTFLSFKVVC